MKESKKRRRIVVGVILLAILAGFFLSPLLFDSGRKEVSRKAENSIDMEPQFSKEGALAFLTATEDTITVVDLEIADNDQERTQGMMYRSSMSHDRAMLFIMQYEREQSFWMRNTKLSLDIMYVNGNFEIVTIYKHTQPYSESPIPSFKKAKYVVETSAGFCDKFGIEEGNFIQFTRVD